MSVPLRRSVRLPCGIDRAFEVFTSQVDAWWPPGHRRFENSMLVFETKAGGRFYERSAAGEEADLGAVQICDPPRRLVYSWRPGSLTEPTRVDVRFSQDGGATLVEITHEEAGAALGDLWRDRVQIFDRSWSTVLAALAAYIADHPPSERTIR
ncbi:MAG: SRPBCC domain-containing protein [Pseudomonadota bacterium]